MRTDQYYFDRVFSTKRATSRIQCRPRGGWLRELTDDEAVRWVQWQSAIPGMLGFLGLFLHYTVFRRHWVIKIHQRLSDGAVRETRWFEPSRREAERTFEALAAWLQSDQDFALFKSARGTEQSL